MMAYGRWWFQPLILLTLPGILWPSSPGTSGGAVLSIPTGARAIGMGEAFTAMADDVSSLYWNPAGLAFLSQSQASFLYNQYLKDSTYQNAATAISLENGAIGGSLSYLSYGQIEGFDASGNPTGDVSAYSGVGTLGGAWLGNNWSAGFNLKGVRETLADVTANGFAADLGTTLIYPKEVHGATLRAAAVVRNLGTGLKLIGQTDPFPTQWRVGVAALQMRQRKLNMSLDYGQERDASGAFYVGTEYWVFPFIAFRAGYAGTEAEGSGLRAGLGLRFKDVAFDYAVSNYGELGISNRYELSLYFGPVNPRLTPAERDLLRRGKLALAQARYGEATELFDALIQLAPTYRPARRLVQVAMAGYEKQEGATMAGYSTSLQVNNTVRGEDPEELKDLENLLNLGAASEKQAQTQGSNNAAQEKP